MYIPAEVLVMLAVFIYLALRQSSNRADEAEESLYDRPPNTTEYSDRPPPPTPVSADRPPPATTEQRYSEDRYI